MANSTAAEPVRLGYEPRSGLLSQLAGELLWPKLLRSVALALRPERLFIGAVTAVLVALVLRAPGASWWVGEPWERAVGVLFGAWWPQSEFAAPPLSVEAAWGPFARFAAALHALWDASWLTTILVVPIATLIFGLGGCIICRIAACDAAQGILVPWMEARRFALARPGSVLFALLAPVVLALVIWLALAGLGAVLFSVAWLNVLGAVAYIFFLLAAALAVVMLAAYAVGFPLIVPAIACEGADGIDALARAYPYVFGRPLRYAAYVLILLLLGYLALGIAQLIAGEVLEFARGAVAAWSGESADRVLAAASETISTRELSASEATAARMVSFWEGLVWVAVGAFAVSYFFCASTMLYLVMRRVCDGQDIGEIWMPGMIEGTMSMTMEARARAASAAPGADPADDT